MKTNSDLRKTKTADPPCCLCITFFYIGTRRDISQNCLRFYRFFYFFLIQVFSLILNNYLKNIAHFKSQTLTYLSKLFCHKVTSIDKHLHHNRYFKDVILQFANGWRCYNKNGSN